MNKKKNFHSPKGNVSSQSKPPQKSPKQQTADDEKRKWKPSRSSDHAAPFPKKHVKKHENTWNSEQPTLLGEEASSLSSLLPGIKPVLELLEANPERVDCVFLRKGRHGHDADRVIDLCRQSKIRFALLDSQAFAKVYEGKSQGVVARLFDAGYTDFDTMLHTVMDAPLPLILALDQIQDPGNAGTLARTLYALGGAGLITPKHNGVYFGPAAAKAAAGALGKLPIAKVNNLGTALDTAKKAGFTIYGAAFCSDENNLLPDKRPHACAVFAMTPRLPAILVLGGEENGIRAGMEKRCDYLLSIPMLRDFDSLNVAQAGAIILAQFLKHVCHK